jgi:hypothetical protein
MSITCIINRRQICSRDRVTERETHTRKHTSCKQLCRNQTGFPGVPVPDENAFPYGRFRSRNIKNDYAAERHVTDGKTKWIYISDIWSDLAIYMKKVWKLKYVRPSVSGYPRPSVTVRRPCIVLLNSPFYLFFKKCYCLSRTVII